MGQVKNWNLESSHSDNHVNGPAKVENAENHHMLFVDRGPPTCQSQLLVLRSLCTSSRLSSPDRTRTTTATTTTTTTTTLTTTTAPTTSYNYNLQQPTTRNTLTASVHHQPLQPSFERIIPRNFENRITPSSMRRILRRLDVPIICCWDHCQVVMGHQSRSHHPLRRGGNLELFLYGYFGRLEM